MFKWVNSTSTWSCFFLLGSLKGGWKIFGSSTSLMSRIDCINFTWNPSKTLAVLTQFVATLALGSRPRQGFARGRAKRETRECGRVWEWTLTLPSELPCWELQSWWTLEYSKSDYKGQNPSPWRVFYIIGNLLKRRCPKWAHMTHLDICNTSYDQKKGRELN